MAALDLIKKVVTVPVNTCYSYENPKFVQRSLNESTFVDFFNMGSDKSNFLIKGFFHPYSKLEIG